MAQPLTWAQFTKQYASKHGLTYGQALVQAGPAWSSYKSTIEKQPKNESTSSESVPKKIRHRPKEPKQKKKQQDGNQNDDDGDFDEIITTIQKRKRRREEPAEIKQKKKKRVKSSEPVPVLSKEAEDVIMRHAPKTSDKEPKPKEEGGLALSECSSGSSESESDDESIKGGLGNTY